ncbi:hypothetical protein [Sinimarinibacterium thermocellulolyticum]|uniref:Uncharacterized protein n=1 Tax=Sinimarinibacterium thermocellulolyticum TaxID=3170016 RepID=A0ABV2AC98_9GAMM
MRAMHSDRSDDLAPFGVRGRGGRLFAEHGAHSGGPSLCRLRAGINANDLRWVRKRKRAAQAPRPRLPRPTANAAAGSTHGAGIVFGLVEVQR